MERLPAAPPVELVADEVPAFPPESLPRREEPGSLAAQCASELVRTTPASPRIVFLSMWSSLVIGRLPPFPSMTTARMPDATRLPTETRNAGQ